MHDADLMDERYGRPESGGWTPLSAACSWFSPDDHTAHRVHTDAVFDGLYAYLEPGGALASGRSALGTSGLRYSTGGTEILKGIDAGCRAAASPRSGRALRGGQEHPAARHQPSYRADGRGSLSGRGADERDGSPSTSGGEWGWSSSSPRSSGRRSKEATLYGARLAGKHADAERLLEMAGLDASFKYKAPQALSVGSSGSPIARRLP